jgi:hypothetical protein
MEMKTKLLISGLAFIAITAVVSAQSSPDPGNQAARPGRGAAYVDANNDGICDNFVSRQASGTQGYRNGNCDGTGQRIRQHRGNGYGQCNGVRQGAPGQGAPGRNRNFVDADKDGICDNREAVSKQ